MNDSIQGRIAVITGGTRGIGKAIGKRLLEEGVNVAICGARQSSVDEALAALSTAAPAGGACVFGYAADLTRPQEVAPFIAAVVARFGTIDILVNNAGVGIFRSTAELAPVDWEKMIGLNLSAVYYCSHAVLPIFVTAGKGDIINIGSLAGKNPFAGGAGYNASKFGLVGFSEAMMLDHRNQGVRVSCIMPGSVDTQFGGEQPGRDSEWKIAASDIAEVVVSLLEMPRRTTISRVEIRPSMPSRGKPK